MSKTTKQFASAIKDASKEKTSAYDTTAVVKRIENGTAWVHIPGGVDETPVRMTIAASVGDSVQVRVSGGSAFLVGNGTAPPTDDKTAHKAVYIATEANEQASAAHTAAERAMAEAEVAAQASTSAQASAAAAATSASNAETSASQAATSASNAATSASNAETAASQAATSASNAATSASNAATSASNAASSASAAGQSASQAQAASEAAQLAALATITTDTIHYLATSASSGVTRQTSGWTTTVQSMTSTNKYLWTYHTYTSANGSTTDTDPVITGRYGTDGSNGDDGSTIWTTGTAPTTPNYTFTISNLSGVSGATPKVGDIIVYSYYRYTITSVSSTTVLAGSRTSIRGAAGASSKWYTGNKITGTSTTARIFSNSGISSAVVGDMYLNIETNNTYRCTTAGAASAAKWVYVDNIQGEQGIQGIQGIQGDTGVSVTAVQPQYYLSTSSSSATGGSWSNALSYVVGKYIWTRDQISYSNNTTGYSTAIYNEALTQSCEDAAEALGLIEEQQEYFWHDSLGAHVLSDKSTVSGIRYRTDIKGAGLEIFEIDQTDKSVAKFGADGARIGQTDKSRIELDYHSMQLLDKEGNAYLHVSDLRDQNGVAEATDEMRGTGSQKNFSLSYSPVVSVSSLTVDGVTQVEGTDFTLTYSSGLLKFTTAPSSGASIVITYTSSSVKLKAYTLGRRKADSLIGGYSVAEGSNTTARGDYSHAEGYGTEALGNYSHTEGYNTTARTYSHAEGYNTTARHYAHAEGYEAQALGDYSHASGYRTGAQRRSQTAIGEYNEIESGLENARGSYVVVIGNGSSDNSRSNALTVDWTGDVQMGLPNYQTSGSTDKALYDAIVALGWTSDVIV